MGSINTTLCVERTRDNRAVQNVSRPQPRRFQRTDQPPLLTVFCELLRKHPREIYAITEDILGGLRLRFYVDHRFT